LTNAQQLAKNRAARKQAEHRHPAVRAAHAPPSPDLTLACVVHDLNNVFQALMGAASALSEHPQWQGISAAILRSVERGQEITASLVTAGQPVAELAVVVENAISLAKDSMLARPGPSVNFTSEVEPGLVMPQAWAWERVLINLLTNAVHAMPNGGTISVRARSVPQSNPGRIEITVADDGTGIAPELLPTIFEPHVSSRTNNRGVGQSSAQPAPRGLGLHIVHTIVSEQNGAVRAANRPEGGAEFTITIPASAIDARLARSTVDAPLTRSMGA
jgi:signal transduction histidine kinase